MTSIRLLVRMTLPLVLLFLCCLLTSSTHADAAGGGGRSTHPLLRSRHQQHQRRLHQLLPNDEPPSNPFMPPVPFMPPMPIIPQLPPQIEPVIDVVNEPTADAPAPTPVVKEVKPVIETPPPAEPVPEAAAPPVAAAEAGPVAPPASKPAPPASGGKPKPPPPKKPPTPAERAKMIAEAAVAKAKREAEAKAKPVNKIEVANKVVDAVVGNLKADDKEVESKFTPTPQAPKGGVRLIKDLITGKLKPVPNTPPTPTTGPRPSGPSGPGQRPPVPPPSDFLKGIIPDILRNRLSAVAQAALAGRKNGERPNVPINISRPPPPGGRPGPGNPRNLGRPGHGLPPNHPINLPNHRRHKGDETEFDVGKPGSHHQRGKRGRRGSHRPGQSKDDEEEDGPSDSFLADPRKNVGTSGNDFPMHIHVGATIGQPNIIEDGLLKSAWNISETSLPKDIKLSLVTGKTDFTDFYLWRTAATDDAPNRQITVQKPFVFVNDSELVSVKVTAWNNRQMTPVPLVGANENRIQIDEKTKQPIKKNELLFNLQYECRKEGTALVRVVMRAFERSQKHRGEDSLSWSFIKVCGKPSRYEDEINTEGNAAIPGLSIGSRNNLSDIVTHGEAKPEWSLGTEDQEKHSQRLHIYDESVEGAKFWMRYEPPVAPAVNLTVNKALFIIDDPTVLLVEDSGDLTEQQTTLLTTRTYTISLTFTCKKKGSSEVTIAFAFPSLDQAKVSFTFLKECGGLAVGDGAFTNGVDIWMGTEPIFNESNPTETREPDVVKNGLVHEDFKPSQNLTDELLKLMYSFNAEATTVAFFVKLRKGYHPVEYDPPVVEAYTQNGAVIMHPTLGGALLETSKLDQRRARYLILSFNCVKEGEAVVTVKLPFRPSGSIQFNMRKICNVTTEEQAQLASAVSEYSTGDELTPLPGINMGTSINLANIVQNGIPNEFWHISEEHGLIQAPAKSPFVGFFLWKNTSVPDAKDVRFGRPELITTADIARPTISGLGAEGGLITDNEYSTIVITFHCFTAGETTMTVIIPLVGDEWLNADQQPVKITPARADPIKISFTRICPAAEAEPISGMGGLGISGFSIGLTPNSTELVYNGFPTTKYFGQRTKPKPDWDDIIVRSDVESTTVYLHYNSNKALKNAVIGNEVIFQAPVVIAHNPTARPVLGGTASAGGVLVRDGDAVPLDLTYNCRYDGLAVITILIPIVPHGQISVTIPKQCKGDTVAPHGVKVTGLQVGITAEGQEVVKDGQTSSSYISYATKKHLEHKVYHDESQTTFYIRKDGEPIRALEPFVFASKPIVNIRLSHALLVNSSEIDEDIDGDEIEINDEVGMINLTYACVGSGTTDVTVSLNLLPQGQVQWTFQKECSERELTNSQEPITNVGDALKRLGTDDTYAMYQQYIREGPPQPLGPAIISGGGGDINLVDSEDDFIRNMDHINPHTTFDSTDRSRFQQPGLSVFRIGTSRTGELMSDVFERSLPQLRYRITTKNEKLDIQHFAVIKPDHETSTFYLSSTSAGVLPYGTPTVEVSLTSGDKKQTNLLQPTLSGPGSVAGTLTKDDFPKKLEVTYNCARGGVYSVVIRIPVGSYGEQAMFRVLKICTNYDIQEESTYLWTAPRILSTIVGTVVFVGIIVGWMAFKKVYQEKKLSAGNAAYAPVQTTEMTS